MTSRRLLAALIQGALVCACSAAAVPSAGSAGSAGPAVPRAANSAPATTAGSTPPVRWVAVSVATLWVKPAATRPVDRPALTNPAHPGRWVASMTVEQKRWLVGKLETQALYGTKVYVLATSGSWTRVAVPSQRTPRTRWGYPGWLPTGQLTRAAPATTARVAVVRTPTAWLWRDAASIGSRAARVMDLSYDTRLPVAKVTSSTVEVVVLGGAHRVLRRSVVQLHTWGTSWHPGRAKAVAEARKFLGLQYLWAGMSGFGYDCSGFTYSVLRSMGVTIPRDASRQAVNGTPVAKAQLRPGDLVFFENTAGAVFHVGMYYGLHDGVRSVIHAPRTGVALHITPLSAWSSAQYAGARRYLLS